jgi:ubiquinone/menaquinone biosynthesis C-methylase UbiE
MRRPTLWWRFIRFGFRLLYNQLAWSYDVVSWVVSLGQWRAWQRAGLGYVRGQRVLEVAHGTGHMLLALHAAGYSVTGFDLSPAMGRIARKRLKQVGVTIPLVRGDALTLPFAPATFDTIFSTFPADFILQPATLGSMARVLVPGGRLVIVMAGFLAGNSLARRFLEWLYRITGQRPGGVAGGSLLTELSQTPAWRAAEQRLATAGFAARLEPARLARSEALVVIADRPGDNPA